jgi:hypothetical protein
VLALLTFVAAVYSVVASFPRGPILAVLPIGAAIAAWYRFGGAVGSGTRPRIDDGRLRFSIRPGVLRVRIARAHPGASPSAALPPESVLGTAGAVFAIAAGRPPS